MWFRGVQIWNDKRWGTGWHWKPHGYKTTQQQSVKEMQLDKCPGAGQNQLFWATKRTKNKHLAYVKCTIPNKFGCNVELQTDEERAKCKSRHRKKTPAGS